MKPKSFSLYLLFAGALLAGGCAREQPDAVLSPDEAASAGERAQERVVEDWPRARAQMVRQIQAYGVADRRVLDAMATVRRHLYIPEDYRSKGTAYGDHPCPIGHKQTISQPYIVAYMTGKMRIQPGEKVLEIGTGSGYQAAVLAELGAQVYSIEIVRPLAEHARRVLKAEGYGAIRVLAGDGYKGWPEHAPFDVVIVTCAPADIPEALVEQLAENGRMILPLGTGYQRLVILRKSKGRVHKEEDLPVRFVPMVKGKGGGRGG